MLSHSAMGFKSRSGQFQGAFKVKEHKRTELPGTLIFETGVS
jgi:hypothetical protein